jgi:hypothetical protein
MDKRLRVILYALAGYAFDKFQKFLIITDIFRTEEERKEIYKDNQAMAEKVGVHEVWRAADIRTHNFTSFEVTDLVGWLNEHFEYTGGKPTALAHDVAGYHLHLQVDGDGLTQIRARTGS